MDLKGKLTLRGKSFKDYRLSFAGGLKISENLVKAVPFLMILDQQKNKQGIYPLTITGRVGKPIIRIGKFKLPI